MAKKQNSYDDKRKEMNQELDGFKDVLDLMNESQKEQLNNITQDGVKKSNPFELLNFLESEFKRLSKLDIFFTQKIHTLEEFSQTEALLEQEREAVEEMKYDLIKKLKHSDSPLQKHMGRIFNGSLY